MPRFTDQLNILLRDRRSGSTSIATQFCHLCLTHLRQPGSRVRGNTFLDALKQLTDEFPTMAILRTLQDRLRPLVNRRHDEGEIAHGLGGFIDELSSSRRAAAVQFVRVARRHRSFLTLSSSSAVLDALRAVTERNMTTRPRVAPPRVVVCESRPAREGILMARKLHRAGCKVTVITDAAMGTWIEQVDAVILGADWIDRKGFINKTGSKAASQLAAHHRKPVYVIGDSLRMRNTVFPESRLPISDRREILSGSGGELMAENQLFERVAWSREHVLVTESICAHRT